MFNRILLLSIALPLLPLLQILAPAVEHANRAAQTDFRAAGEPMLVAQNCDPNYDRNCRPTY